jgi:hypothetical protein
MDKHHIINEIIHTTKENDGIPLGQARFLQETGIKISDWHGKFWARWSDAQQEAGIIPNQMQGAYEDNFLIQKLIEFIRELGYFPVKGELLLKKRNNPEFPNHKTFGRFGTKKQLISRIIEYCREHGNYDDVLELCTELQNNEKQPSKEKGLLQASESYGSVYLLKSGRHYKIGKTNASGRREYELRIQLPDKAETIHVITTDDPTGIEAYWHNRFKAKRKNGEWFELKNEDIQAFKRRKFM